MKDLSRKRVPYGWCMDHCYVKSIYDKMTWQEYVKMLEDWLNEKECNYSVVHYKYSVRVHVYFSALEKMGYKNAVKLYWMSYKTTDTNKLLGRNRGWKLKDIRQHVKVYFLENGLDVDS